MTATTHPLKTPDAALVAPLSNTGTRIPAIDLLRVFSPSQWEDFTLEWAHSLKSKYSRVEKCGGAGDLGRDVVAFVSDSEWHNYQCKHYKDPLQPAQILIELGKLCYYIHEGAFTPPTTYSFVAPQGAGNSLSRLIREPKELRDRLIADWDSLCASKISSTKTVPLKGKLKTFVRKFDFSIVDYVPPMDLLEQHSKTRWHAARFPGGLPQRPPIVVPPLDQETFESPYIEQLLDAYSDHKGESLDVDSLSSHEELKRHLIRSRERFFHAESLRIFSRDNFPPGQFESLQEEFFDGVIDNVENPKHADGYQRVRTTTAIAQGLAPSNNALRDVLGSRDKAGICHQLADEDRLKWVQP